jgi:hypothetical protein
LETPGFYLGPVTVLNAAAAVLLLASCQVPRQTGEISLDTPHSFASQITFLFFLLLLFDTCPFLPFTELRFLSFEIIRKEQKKLLGEKLSKNGRRRRLSSGWLRPAQRHGSSAALDPRHAQR